MKQTYMYLCVFTITSIITSHAFNSSTLIIYLADVVQENHINSWNCYVLLFTSLMFFLLCSLTFSECRMLNALFKSFKLLWWSPNSVYWGKIQVYIQRLRTVVWRHLYHVTLSKGPPQFFRHVYIIYAHCT